MNTDLARQQMIEQQVRSWNVLDANVLNGLRNLPREHFVPDDFSALAFADTEIPIGHGQFMMTPTIEGRVLQALGLTGNENVLEIGTGSGFLTACLAKLSARVTSIDLFDDFLERATERLASSDIDNVELIRMDAMHEIPDGGFDAIAVTGSVQEIDSRLKDALNPGGRLFAVAGDAPAMSATRVQRTGTDSWHSETLFETHLAPLLNGPRRRMFSF